MNGESRHAAETPPHEARCVALHEVMALRGDTDPSMFEPLGLEIFDGVTPAAASSRKRRDSGWFARKLRRECVDIGRSLLVVEGDDARDPGSWLGYALLGLPRSYAGLARTAGIGLIPRARGRGLGGLLLRALVRSSRAAGDRGLRVLAEPDRVRFYERHGLSVVDTRCTWRADGMGHASSIDAELAFGRTLARQESFAGAPPVTTWFVEAWERTPAHERYVLHSPRGVLHAQSGTSPWRALVSRERGGWLVQRLEGGATTLDDAVASLHQLRGSLPWGEPVFVYAGPPLAPPLHDFPPLRLMWRFALLASGFGPAQAWSVLERIHADHDAGSSGTGSGTGSGTAEDDSDDTATVR